MFAATVLATYDNEFYNDYKGMIEMMIRPDLLTMIVNTVDLELMICTKDIHGQADTQTMIQVTIRNQPVNHYLAG